MASELDQQVRAVLKEVRGETFRHCHDYIGDETQPECLRTYLDWATLPAILKYPSRSFTDEELAAAGYGPAWRKPIPKLYAEYQGDTVRVVMASRFGDVGIVNKDVEHGYNKRVTVAELTNFRTTWEKV